MADEGDNIFLKRFKVEVVDKMAEMEELASDILSDRQQIVELDRKRNSNREALRSLKHKTQGNKSWLCFGNTFIKLSDASAKNMIEEDMRYYFARSGVSSHDSDRNNHGLFPLKKLYSFPYQKTVNEELSSVRTQIKPKVAKLHELEGLPELKGFHLSAMNNQEMDFATGVK